MSLVLNTHAATAEQSATMSIPLIEWGDSWRKQEPKEDDRVKQNKNSAKATMTSFVAPLGSDQMYNLEYSVVKNIYQDSGISVNNRASSTRGVRLYVQHVPIWDVTDTADSSVDIKLPTSTSFSIRVAQHELITEEVILGEIQQTLAVLYDQAPRIAAMIRGSLLPRDVS